VAGLFDRGSSRYNSRLVKGTVKRRFSGDI
jgi:hypothetical protein